jgi:hypothetical protein
VTLVRGVAAVEWGKREKNMTMNHWKIMQSTTLLTKLLNYSFTCTKVNVHICLGEHLLAHRYYYTFLFVYYLCRSGQKM